MEEGAVPLFVVTRGGVQDDAHRGWVAVVEDAGGLVFSAGLPRARAFIRSAAKPIQALPVLVSGAADAYGLDDADLAIMCGSHQGGAEQVAQVRSMLAKAGIAESALQSGTGIADNCSGKHAGMLAACRHLGYPIETYTAAAHPHQQEILRTLASVCQANPTEITIGVDGCSAPIHYLSIHQMALGYARLSRPERHFDTATAAAIARITRAMAAHPGGHTGEPDYAGALGGVRFLTKAGGNGVYCAGVVGKGLGFAMKVEDGSSVPLKPIFTEVLRRLGVLSDAEAALLARRFWPTVVNRRGATVGDVSILI